MRACLQYLCVVSVGAALFVVAGGCGSDDPPPAPTAAKLGVLLALSGSLADYAVENQHAVELAVNEVNAAGGIFGQQVETVVVDYASDPDQAREVTRQLVEEDHVDAIFGPDGWRATLTMLEISAPAQVPAVSCCATGTDIRDASGPLGDRWLVRLSSSVGAEATLLAEHGVMNGACTSVWVPTLAGAEDEAVVAFDAAMRAHSGTLTVVPIVEGMADYTPVLEAALATSTPNCIWLYNTPEAGATIVRNWSAMMGAPAVKWLVGAGRAYDPVFTDGVGDIELIRGMLGTDYALPTGPSYDAFADNWMATYGEPAPIISEVNYDAVVLMLLGMEAAGSRDGVAIRDGMTQISRPNDTGAPESYFIPGEIGSALGDIRDGKDIDYEGASGSCNINQSMSVPNKFVTYIFDPDMPDPAVIVDIVAVEDQD